MFDTNISIFLLTLLSVQNVADYWQNKAIIVVRIRNAHFQKQFFVEALLNLEVDEYKQQIYKWHIKKSNGIKS